MDRRRYLHLMGAGIAAGIAGCGGDGDGDGGGDSGNGGTPTATATPGLTQVSVTAPNMSNPNADYSLDVRWNAVTVTEVTPEGGETITPRSGDKIVVVAFEVTAPSDQSVSLWPSMWRLGATGFQYQPIEASRSHFPEKTASPESTVSGWLAYSIPSAVYNAQFLLSQSETESSIEVAFTKDEDMAIPPV